MPDATDPSNVPAALVGGLTALIAALTAVAAANGAVTRMFRNYGHLVYLAIVAVMLAFLCGLLGQLLTGDGKTLQKIVFAVGACLLIVGIALGVIFQINSTSLSDRPNIATTTATKGSATEVDAVVTASGEKSKAQLLVVVFGQPVKARAHASEIYYGKSGPNTDGKLEQDAKVLVPSGRYREVRVYAAVYNAQDNAGTVDCDGNIVEPNGAYLIDAKTHDKIKALHPDRTACLVINLEGTDASGAAKKS